MTFFNEVVEAPVDPILGLVGAFQADARPDKVNLSVGVFKTADLKTPILSSVKQAEALFLQGEKSKEYLPIDGPRSFIKQVGPLVFGEAFWGENGHRISGAQSLGGTGALRIAADFLRAEVGEEIYVSDPTWPNHKGVMTHAGFKVSTYPYYNMKTHQLQFEKLLNFVSGLEKRSILLLHATCHNPTGADPSLEEWKKLSLLCLEKKVIPFFDCAYQGFAYGLEEDVKAVRLFAEEGHQMVVASSFSKNFGLYAERVGALFVVTGSEETAGKVSSKLKIHIRTSYSNPPLHGGAIVTHILEDPVLRKEWELEVASMRKRIESMRMAFANELILKSKKRDFRYLKERNGMFCFSGLDKAQVEQLKGEYAIYMTSDGRINVCGLNQENIDYVVHALLKVGDA